MSSQPFSIGEFRCSPVAAGRFRLDGGAMFGVVPKLLWNRVAPADENNRIEMVMRPLLIERDEKKILIDTGIGNKLSQKQRANYAIDAGSDTALSESLHALGLTEASITDCILTHLHFDHASGATTRRADGAIVPTFPNATYYLQKSHYDWALQNPVREKASFWPENYEPIVEAGKLRLLEDQGSLLFPELELIVSDGHTIGMQLVRIRSRGESLIFTADLIPMHAHVPLPWIMGYDNQPLRLIEEKERLLTEAAAENSILYFQHDPAVPTCRVKKGEKGFVSVTA